MKVADAKIFKFKTKITPKVFVLSAMPFGCAGLLLCFALDAFRKFDPNDPARIPFVGVPTLIALALVVAVGWTLAHFLGREIVVEDEYLVYKDSKTELHLEIRRMAFSPPPDTGFFKMLMFSDGETFVQIPEIFTGEQAFKELAEAISQRRRRSRTAGRETYSL